MYKKHLGTNKLHLNQKGNTFLVNYLRLPFDMRMRVLKAFFENEG